MRKLLSLLSLLFVFCLGFSALSAFAEGESAEEIYVTGADILRGARSNVNRELMSVNPEPDGVAFRAAFETEKPIAKFAVKREVLFTENFAVETEILQADPDCTVDIGFLYGDIDEAWLDPWDFYGVDMSDAGSLFKFKNIGGFTVRFSMSGAYTPTVMMKGIGEDLNRATFAVAGVTESLSFLSERDLTLVKEGNDWSIRSGGARLTVEENATLLNPYGSTLAQSFLNAVLDDFLNENVYVFIAMEGHDGARAQLKVKGAGGKIFAAPFGEDPLVGNADYQKDPDREIEFSLIENYLCGMPEYADRTFTYLSQPYQNPSYLCTEKGVYLSGRDKLYGINADLSYLAPFSVFDGFSAVLGAGNMPKTTSAVNSNISLTLSGQKFASYYAWNSVYIKITFPYETIAEGFFANVFLWDKPVYNNGALSPALLAEMPVSYIPAVEGDNIVVKIAKAKGNYYVYVNGVRFGDGFETQMKQTVGAIEEGYTDNSGTQRGFYVSTLNNTSYLADGTGVDDGVLNGVAGHYLKQIGGALIVNKEPTLKAAQSPYAPEKSDITANSVKLSFSSELPERTDGNFTVDGYLVERYVNGEADGSFILKGIGNRTFTDGNLRSDTRYIYRVYAVQGSDSDSPVKLVA